MHKSVQSIYSRNYRNWIPLTRHRAGDNLDPNTMHIGDGYITGTGGMPVPQTRLVNASGVEQFRVPGGSSNPPTYSENDEVHAKVRSLSEISVFYVRYNQVKELLFDLGDLTNVLAIGLRNNGIAGLGHVDMSNAHKLLHIDLSGNGSITQLSVSPQALINFYYLGGCSLPQSNIDYLIQRAVDSGVTGGTMQYDGRPSYDATANYDLLASRGWNMSLAPFAGTINKLGDTSTGVSNGVLITASHRIRFNARNADGGLRHTGAFSAQNPGDLPDFINDGWVETEYYQPAVLSMKLDGKQLKTLTLQHMANLEDGQFPNNNITTVSLTGMAQLKTLNLRYNPLASISGIADTVLTNLDLRDTNLGSTAIDAILATLNAEGRSNGIFQYSVKPNTGAVADYDALVARGWTLSIEPDRIIVYNPTAVAIDFETVYVNWDDIAGATQYQIQQDLNRIDPVTYPVGSWLDTSPQPSGTISEMTFVGDYNPEINYVLRVRAMVAGVWRNWSVEFEFTTPAQPIPVPVVNNFTSIAPDGFRANWSAVTGATGYEVRHKASSSGTWGTPISTGTTLFKDYSGLTANTSYDVQVRALDANGVSDWSATATTFTKATIVSIAYSNATANAITVSWSPVETGVNYKLYKKEGAGAYVLIYDGSGVGTFTATGLSQGTFYQFAIEAWNSAGVSTKYGSSVPTTPTAPSSLTATNIAQTSLTLNWVNGMGQTSIEILSGKVNEPYVLRETIPSTSTTYNATGLDSGSQYFFKVRAVNISGTASVENNFTTLTGLTAPSGITLSAPTTSSLTINWSTPATGHTGYNVEYRVNGATTWNRTGNLASNVLSFTQNSLSSGTVYQFRVRAYNGTNEVFSTIVQGQTSPTVTGLPLDNIPSGTYHAAYSFRKLRTAYTGSCIRVRRGSDSAEMDIGFVNNVLDTATLNSFCSGTTAFVNIWYDQSGLDYIQNMPNAALQPQIKTATAIMTLNSKPAIYFNNTTYLDTPFISEFNELANGTVNALAVIVYSNEGTESNYIYGSYISNGRYALRANQTGGSMVLQNGQVTGSYGAQSTVSVPATGLNVISNFYNPTAAVADRHITKVNGGADLKGNTFTGDPLGGAPTNRGMALGNQTGGTGANQHLGFIQEAIFLKGNVATYRLDLDSEVNNYY